jgi:prepilin signal peptidase PulO-like enzyme (type II secretory pathway)
VENIHDAALKQRYTIGLTIIYALIILFAVVTMQFVVGLTMAVIVSVFAIAFYCIDMTSPETENQKATLLLACGVIVAAIASAIAPWLLWAVVFAVLFLHIYVLSRIEQRLAMLEYQSTRRVLRRHTRGGASQRHRG